MILDGLEIAGIGMGMVFLALVTILVITFVLRFAIGRIEEWKQPRSAIETPPPPTPKSSPTSSSKAAKVAAIAVALYLTERGRKAQRRKT